MFDVAPQVGDPAGNPLRPLQEIRIAARQHRHGIGHLLLGLRLRLRRRSERLKQKRDHAGGRFAIGNLYLHVETPHVVKAACGTKIQGAREAVSYLASASLLRAACPLRPPGGICGDPGRCSADDKRGGRRAVPLTPSAPVSGSSAPLHPSTCAANGHAHSSFSTSAGVTKAIRQMGTSVAAATVAITKSATTT
jgi:hypothetical protein